MYRVNEKHVPWKLYFAMALLLVCGISIQAIAEPAEANDSEEFFEMSLEELMDIEVTVASRKSASQKETPGIVTVITRDEIQKSGARDLIDILRLVPGFEVTHDTAGAYGVSVRGIWANEGKVLVLMDGIELNDDMYSTFQYGHHIPVDIIDRIEIMRGPGSVMYGESAELGVISIKTISPQKENDAFISSTYGRTNKTFNRKNVTGFYGTKKDDFSFSIASHYGRGNFSDRVSDNYDLAGNDMDLGIRKNSKVTSPFFNIGLKWGNFSARTIIDRYGLNSPWPNWGMYKKQFYSDIVETKYQLPISDDLSMTSRFVYKHQKPWNYQSIFPGSGDYFHKTSDKYKGETYFSYDMPGGHNIVTGVTYEQIGGRDNAREGGMGGGQNKVNYYSAAVYGEGFFKTPYGNLTLGGRQVKHNFSGSKFVPRAALTKQLGDYHIKAIYSQAYRNPSILNIAANSDIKPEKTTIYEFELGRQMTDNWLVTANVFDVEVDDPIIYYYSGSSNYTNFKKVASRGVEVSSIYKKGTTNVTLSYSYYRMRENEVDEYIVPGHDTMALGIPSHKLTLLASFSPYKNVFITPSLIYNSSKYGVTDYTSDYVYKKIDPTLLANISLLFKDAFNKKNVDLSFSIYNLFDERYEFAEPYLGGYSPLPGPSRTFTMNLRYKF